MGTSSHKHHDSQPFVTNMVFGSTSSFFSVVCLQPLDVVKTRLQRDSAMAARKAVWKMPQVEGFRTLWSGMVPALYRTVPGIGLYFANLHWITSVLRGPDNRTLAPWEAFTASFVTRAMVTTVTMPMSVVKTRFESGLYPKTSISQALAAIVHSDGYRGLFRGLTATIARDAPFSAIFYTTYDYTKRKLQASEMNRDTPPFAIHATAAISGGLVGSTLTTPFDVIRARMMMYPNRYSGTIATARTIYQNEGLAVFSTGILLRQMRRSLMTLITWSIYEHLSSPCK